MDAFFVSEEPSFFADYILRTEGVFKCDVVLGRWCFGSE